MRATATGNNGAGDTSLSINIPAGTTSGDVMIAFVVVHRANNAIAAPSGWSLLLRQDSSSAISTASYVKVAGPEEPVSYSWFFGSTGEASGGIASYTGVNTTTPVDARHAQYNQAHSNADNSGIITTTSKEMLVYVVGAPVATTVTVPAGFTEEWSATSSSSTTAQMSQKLFASSGATGPLQGKLNGGTNVTITQLLALKPAGGSATLTPKRQPEDGISLRATATGNNGAGDASLTIKLPAGTINGDVMIAFVVVHRANNAIAAPSGWSLLLRQDSSSAISTASYVKVAGPEEPVSYSWFFGSTGEASGGIASYSGVNTTTPVDARHAQYNQATTNVDNSGLSTTTSKEMLVYAVGIPIATTVTAPSGFSEEWSSTSSSSTTAQMSQKLFASSGATGAIHGKLNGGTNVTITQLLALKPAGRVANA